MITKLRDIKNPEKYSQLLKHYSEIMQSIITFSKDVKNVNDSSCESLFETYNKLNENINSILVDTSNLVLI